MVVPQDGRQLLCRLLEGPIAHEQNVTPVRRCGHCAEQGSDRVADRTPVDGANEGAVRRELQAKENERRSIVDVQDVPGPEVALERLPIGNLGELRGTVGMRARHGGHGTAWSAATTCGTASMKPRRTSLSVTA